ncbi:MAG: hypothetical protein ABW157_20870 [Candidatus Thiodiazotropha sp. LLP2]
MSVSRIKILMDRGNRSAAVELTALPEVKLDSARWLKPCNEEVDGKQRIVFQATNILYL